MTYNAGKSHVKQCKILLIELTKVRKVRRSNRTFAAMTTKVGYGPLVNNAAPCTFRH